MNQVSLHHAHPTRTKSLSLPRHAIQSGRGDYRRTVIREEIARYDRLKKHYEDPTYEVVSGVFRALAKKKIVGAGSFQR
jgi:hypothetical protein